MQPIPVKTWKPKTWNGLPSGIALQFQALQCKDCPRQKRMLPHAGLFGDYFQKYVGDPFLHSDNRGYVEEERVDAGYEVIETDAGLEVWTCSVKRFRRFRLAI